LDRRNVIAALASLGSLFPGALLRAQPSKVWRIGFLGAPSAAGYAGNIAAFRRGLRELGYIEGKNVAIEERWADGKYERLPELARELIQLKVDLIVTTTTPAARAAQQSTTTLPILAVNVADPIGSGLVTSLSRPGGNITGLANFVGDTIEKQFELLAAVVPKLSRIGVLSNPANQSMQGLIQSIHKRAQKIGVRVILVEARKPEEIEPAFSAVAQQRADALIVLAEPLFFLHRWQVVDLASKTRLPVIYNGRKYVEAGGLMSYGADVEEIHRYAARYVDKILKGAKPADLPIEQPRAMELTINRKTARTLGLRLPQDVLALANKVID